MGGTDIEKEGVEPPLSVGCEQLWASPGLPLTYTHTRGVHNVKSMGGGAGGGRQKCDERSTSSPQNAKNSLIDEPCNM